MNREMIGKRKRIKRNSTARWGSRGRRPTLEALEHRRVLAASFGWDGPGLGSAELTYTVGNAPDSLSQAEVDQAIRTAFDAWSDVVDVSFEETDQVGLRDSIDISFTSIDGRGGTLAQAYFPDDVNPARIAGDIQFDASESWEVGNSQGNRAFDLVWVAVHEIGHSLGLEHIEHSDSVLQAFVSPNQQFTSLDDEDIEAAQALYASSSLPDALPVSDTMDNDAVEDAVGDGVDDPADDVHSPEDTASDNTDQQPSNRDRFERYFRRIRRFLVNFQRGFSGFVSADVPIEHNAGNATDANGDGSTTATDALMIVNRLSNHSAGADGMCDVNADGEVTAGDALMVINSLGQDAVATGEADVVVIQDTVDPEAEPEDETTMENEPEVDEPEVDESEIDESEIDEVDVPDMSEEDNGDQLDDEPEMMEPELDQRRRRHARRAGKLLRDQGERLFQRFDVDGNDALTEDEVPERVFDFLTDLQIDADSDGVITRDEVADYAEDAAQQRLADRFSRRDANEDGLLTEDEVSERFWDKVSAADEDGDSAVSLDELSAWKQQREEGEGDDQLPPDSEMTPEDPANPEQAASLQSFRTFHAAGPLVGMDQIAATDVAFEQLQRGATRRGFGRGR